MKRIQDILPDITPPEPFDKAEVVGFSLDKKARSIEMALSVPEVENEGTFAKLRRDICNFYRLDLCEITKYYPSAEATEAFFERYYPVLSEEIGRRIPALKYVLMGSRWALSEGALTITVIHGGTDILTLERAEEKLHTLILDQTSLSLAVTFLDELEEVDMPVLPEVALPTEKPAKKHTVQKDFGGDVLVGKPIRGTVLPIAELDELTGDLIVKGEVLSAEARELRNGKKVLIKFILADKTGAVGCKFFAAKDKAETLMDELLPGKDSYKAVCVQGTLQNDIYEHDMIISVRSMERAVIKVRGDDEPVKRVELHCHTQMSAMDAVCSASSIVRRAVEWGMSAVAITDHGVVQAYPEALKAKGKNPIKILYGVEGYLVPDEVDAVTNATSYPLTEEFVVFDIETTGLDKSRDAITEIGAVKMKGDEVTERFSSFVNPGRHIPQNITELTGITDDMVKDAPDEKTAVAAFLDFCGGAPVIAHNAKFDTGFIRVAAQKHGLQFDNPILCTLIMAQALLSDELKKFKLNIIADYLNIDNPNHHRAVNDAEVTGAIWAEFRSRLSAMEVTSIDGINKALGGRIDIRKTKNCYHVVILIKEFKGVKNLYKIISESHLKYFGRTPRIPKSLLQKYRDGLIVGSACEAGELYRAMVAGRSEAELEAIASFYDYLEIQPLKNNAFMIREGTVRSEAELIEFNKRILALGDKLGKLTVATCDTHFLDPEDEVYRRILMDAKGFEDADNQAPLYFRNTREMLDEFRYLGDRAYEVVIENTNKIADMIEDIVPIKDGNYPPSIENSAEELKELCYEKAYRLYGDPLPEFVRDRLERELNPIIEHGYDVMYMIAQKLVKKSIDDGYIVGSRGSVGSSFVAFLSGITEINSLPAHYLCPQCRYLEFPKVAPGMSGCDMESKSCPQCGTPLKKEGHDIPFETFLGFNADKVPDIDLNFSGEYQTKAHKYTEVLFGEGYVFKAGTIGTVAEKTAFGYVKKYFEKRGIQVRNAEVERLKIRCTGVKRTTGQHPGGVIVCPKTLDIHDFTPVQHPADDPESDVITTHFDYHSIHDNLLKLDILGHDDPTVIRMLEDLTGTKVQDIELDDPETMSLFSSTKALGVTPEAIASPVGTYGIPEFGTRIVRNMLVETKPKSFSELIRISGLSHGTDVWFGNAQELVQSKTCTLNSCICTRDDIMAYLISMGLPNGVAFKIMESVRKGKGLSDEWQALMREHNVPEWYIDSCLKIKYMFPKAHAAAYVTNAFRIAWYKVHRPVEYYIAYFSIRADEFDYDMMTRGYDYTCDKIAELEKLGKEASAREKNLQTILEICREMYARGIEFEPISLYRSDATKFVKSESGKIIPPLSSIANLGAGAAKQIVSARNDGGGEFFSIEDIRQRAHVGKSITDLLAAAGVLRGMNESSQTTLFENLDENA